MKAARGSPTGEAGDAREPQLRRPVKATLRAPPPETASPRLGTGHARTCCDLLETDPQAD